MKTTIQKQFNSYYLRDILILISTALILGIYLIATTVVVSKDSVTYLHRAQFLQENPDEESIVYIYRTRSLENDPDMKIKPADILAERPSGYELLILTSYRIFHAITGNSSIQGWIWAGQALTLLSRVLAVIALYLVGRLITHRQNSFWGCMILLFLPEPAYWGSDVLREWPYLLFMALSVLSVLYGIRRNSVWLFGLAGIWGGIGFLIRLESIQLFFLGLFVLCGVLLKPRKLFSRSKALFATVLLIAGFTGPVLIYAGYSGQFTTNYLKHYIEKVLPISSDSKVNEANAQIAKEPDTTVKDASGSTVHQSTPEEKDITSPQESDTPNERVSGNEKVGSLSRFCYELLKDTGELLIWFYLPFWIIGLYSRLRNKADPMVRWMIGVLLLMGTGMILMRYFYKEAIVTQRWIFPIVAITVFYIYTGIEKFGGWIVRKKSPDSQNLQIWTRILITIGILLYLTKVNVPLGMNNKSYLEAVKWIKANTHDIEWLYTHDKRIPFYAERGFIEYDNNQDGFDLEPYDAVCLIVPSENERAPDNPPEGLILEACFGTESEKDEKFCIYRYERSETSVRE